MSELDQLAVAKGLSAGRKSGNGIRRRRILVSAYAFSPVLGSEPGIGWNVCSRLAAYHDVTVLTRSWNEALWPQDEAHREEAKRFMRENGPIPGLTVHFVDSPPLSRLFQPRPLVSLRSPLFFQGYAAWQRAAYRKAVRLHRARPFACAHQLTIGTFREPGYLWKLGVPFLWGPISGGDNIPWSYFADFGRHDRLYYAVKNVANRMHMLTKWRSRMAAQRAQRVLVSTPALHGTVAAWGGSSRLMLDAGAPSWAGRPRCYDGGRPLRLCWIGLHVGRKALPLLLRAVLELKRRGLGGRFQLTIMGTGPEMPVWRALCQRLQVEETTTWMGQVPFAEVRKELDRHDVVVMSSLQEGTSNVVMEGLAAGLPIVCHDIAGMSVAVDATCGLKVPLRDRENSVRGFADAISKLVTTRGLVNRLSEGALCRVEKLSWNEKAREIASAYDQIAQSDADGGSLP
jgi:glycosyltransferase involved in cell wall biosynthesis